MHQRRALICLDFGKAFDMVCHHILLSNVQRHGRGMCTAQWMKNWLDGLIQGVLVRSSVSGWPFVRSSGPQETPWETVLIIVFINDSGSGFECTLKANFQTIVS